VIAERVSPANVDAEAGLLGCILLDGGQEIMASCLEARVAPDDFFKPGHQLIFEALRSLYEKGTPADEITLSEELQRVGQLEEAGGYPALSELTTRIDTTAHFKYWLGIVKEKAIKRSIIKAGTSLVDAAYLDHEDIQTLLDTAEKTIFAISRDQVSDSVQHISSVVDKFRHSLTQDANVLHGLHTGFLDLDAKTSGLHAGEMIVLAARPSIGKTSLALNIAANVALPKAGEIGQGVLIFSIEMSADQLVQRMACSRASVNSSKLRQDCLNQEDREKLDKAADEIHAAPIWIDDAPSLNILELRAKARRMVAQHSEIGLVIIDYLQLLTGTDRRISREQQISEMSSGLKALAKELKIPVLVLSQLNRSSEINNRPPRLSDLRESGAIEQDADVVLLMSKPGNDGEESTAVETVEINIAKQRNGPVGRVRLAWQPAFTRFENLSYRQRDNNYNYV